MYYVYIYNARQRGWSSRTSYISKITRRPCTRSFCEHSPYLQRHLFIVARSRLFSLRRIYSRLDMMTLSLSNFKVIPVRFLELSASIEAEDSVEKTTHELLNSGEASWTSCSHIATVLLGNYRAYLAQRLFLRQDLLL